MLRCPSGKVEGPAPSGPRLEFQLVRASIEKPPPLLDVPGHGAMVEFLGVVRPEENAARITALDYEAYDAMVEGEMTKLLDAIASRHPILAAQVIHRVGRVPVGEISLRVRVHTKHRREAFAACEEIIERLKQHVPIWKHAVSAP